MRYITWLLIISISTLVGCGKKGDLLPPDYKPATTQPTAMVLTYGTSDTQQ